MKINYTSRSGRVSVELDAETQRDAFQQLSDFQEIFGKLFPRRKDKEGNWLPDSGWVKWDKKKGALV